MSGRKYILGPDIDLGQEEVQLPSGERLTEARASEIAEETLRGVRGRPSLTGHGQHSPRVSFRLPAEERELAERVAQQEGKTVSALAREALEHYLAERPGA
ncbi:MAG TPA: hypothetical protein VEO01_06050 [Pseudonocardiaceae bacterium]|nr:hypothetical protein [Pseudonocardiaceae bacterium]